MRTAGPERPRPRTASGAWRVQVLGVARVDVVARPAWQGVAGPIRPDLGHDATT